MNDRECLVAKLYDKIASTFVEVEEFVDQVVISTIVEFPTHALFQLLWKPYAAQGQSLVE